MDLGVFNFTTFVDTDGTASIVDGKYNKNLSTNGITRKMLDCRVSKTCRKLKK